MSIEQQGQSPEGGQIKQPPMDKKEFKKDVKQKKPEGSDEAMDKDAIASKDAPLADDLKEE
jgi:hypothetical protein